MNVFEAGVDEFRLLRNKFAVAVRATYLSLSPRFRIVTLQVSHYIGQKLQDRLRKEINRV